MASAFEGFSSESISFLETLGTKDKAWFDENRKRYQRLVAEPTKAFVVALGERLQAGFAPAIEAQPKTNGSIAPINNDLRFSPDKSPYKDHIFVRLWEGPTKKTAPTLFVRLAPDGVGFATGVMLNDLDAWRALIDGDAGATLAKAIEKLAAGRDLDVAGEEYKRVPKPYPEDHPRASLLRHKMFQARWVEPLPASLDSAAFADHCYERLADCSEIHRWFVEHLA